MSGSMVSFGDSFDEQALSGEVVINSGEELTQGYIWTLAQYYFDVLSKFKYFDVRTEGATGLFLTSIKVMSELIVKGNDSDAMQKMRQLINYLSSVTTFQADHLIMWPVVKAMMQYWKYNPKGVGKGDAEVAYRFQYTTIEAIYNAYSSVITDTYFNFWSMISSFTDMTLRYGESLYSKEFIVSISATLTAIKSDQMIEQNSRLSEAFKTVMRAGYSIVTMSVTDAYALLAKSSVLIMDNAGATPELLQTVKLYFNIFADTALRTFIASKKGASLVRGLLSMNRRINQ